jgi:hypothetical protein
MHTTLIGHLRRNVVAYLALFIALGGTAYAATLPANSVGTRQLVNGGVRAEDIGKLPSVYAFTRDPAQPLSDGTFAAVRLEQEIFDVGGMHSPGSEDSRLVAPRTGTYVVEGTAVFGAGGACGGSPRVALIQRHLRGGGTVDVDHVNSDTRCSELTRVHAGGVVRLKSGDYLELLALQRSATSVPVAGNLSAAYVGG